MAPLACRPVAVEGSLGLESQGSAARDGDEGLFMIGGVGRLECIMPCLSNLRGGQRPVRVLALDTTAAVCSVSLLVVQGPDAEHHHRSQPLTPGQSRSVLAMIDRVLAQADEAQSRSPVDLIGFGAGPGAFTGLRVACGVAQGLALGWDCRVVPVDSLTTLAWQAAQADPFRATPIVVALDVRMNEVAFARFDSPRIAGLSLADQIWPQACFGPVLCAPEQAADWIVEQQGHNGALRFAGDAFRVYPALAAHASAAGAEQPDARAVAELALIAGLANQAIDPAEAAPFYLRDKVALDRHEQEQLRASRRGLTP